jgi:hypothetical protein
MKRTFAAAILATVACNGDPMAPTLAACHQSVVPISLSVGADIAIDPGPTGGCIILAGNTSTTDSAEYLLVPQSVATNPTCIPASSWPVAHRCLRGLVAAHGGQRRVAGAQFHDQLRLMGQSDTYPMPAGSARPAAPQPRRCRAPAPAIRSATCAPSKVLANLMNTTLFTNVTATTKSVGQHIIVYVDNNAPANGLSTADYDKLKFDFDTLLYAADVAAFGSESDLDGNGRVIVLMTNVVNKLVTAQECLTTGYVGGFFFAADIAPSTRSAWNNGEVFYTMVMDPDGTLSCPHDHSQVTRVVPVTFIHEFQHMISFPASCSAGASWKRCG